MLQNNTPEKNSDKQDIAPAIVGVFCFVIKCPLGPSTLIG